MRNILKTLFVLTLLTVALSACGSNKNAEIIYGRYLETDITPPADGTFITLLATDGTLAAFDGGLLNRFNSADGGETWTTESGPGRDAPPERYAEVEIAAFLPDGRLIVFIPDEGFVTINSDGTTAPFPVEVIDTAIADEDFVMMLMAQPVDNDRLLLNYNIFRTSGGIMTFSSSDVEEEIEEVSDSEEEEPQPVVQNISAREERVSVSGTVSAGGGARPRFSSFGRGMGGTVSLHDIATGALIEELPVIESGATLLSQRSDGGQYLARDANIILSTEEETDIVLEGTVFAFGSPNNTVVSKKQLDDGAIIIHVLVNGMEHRLFRYAWDDEAPINPERTIAIWALEDNNTVRAAITEVMRHFPDAGITFEVATGGGSAISAEDAIRNLNTRLLSGQAPDILILDGTPLDSYAERGMLMDLSSIDMSDMHGNMLAPFADNGVYVLPTQFMVPVIMGDAERIAGVETLDALVERIVSGNSVSAAGMDGMMRSMDGIPENERPEFHFGDLEEVYDMMWLTGSAAFIENGRLNTDALTRFLSAIDAIDKKYELSAPDGEGMGTFVSVVSFGVGGGRPSVMTGSAVNYMMQNANLAALTLDNLTPFRMVTIRGGDLAPFPGLAENVWIPSTITAVTADTAAPEFAKIFVETMLSLEVQRINHGHGLPITRSAVTAQIDAINEMLSENDLYAQPFETDTNALAQSLTTPAVTETVLRETVWNSVQRLTSGSLTLEGAVREIEANIRIYLAERS